MRLIGDEISYFLFLIFLHGMVRKIVLKQYIYIHIKIFYYQKQKQKKKNIRYVPEMGTFNYAKKIHVCNINQFY